MGDKDKVERAPRKPVTNCKCSANIYILLVEMTLTILLMIIVKTSLTNKLWD